MSEEAKIEPDPMLRPLAEPQQQLLDIIADAAMSRRAWPIWQYVEAKLDDAGLDIELVLAELPTIFYRQVTYPLVHRQLLGDEETPLKLTIAGMAHLPQFRSTVEMFLRVVTTAAERRATAQYNPSHLVTVEFSGEALIRELDLQGEPLVGLLSDILQNEPVTWRGVHRRGDADWKYRPASHLRRFRDMDDVNDYVTRLRAWISPPQPNLELDPVSPLDLVTAFDYLDVVWQLKFGRRLVHLPSAERVARLTQPVTGPGDFDSHLSALGEMFKGLDAEPGVDAAPFEKLRRRLRNVLPSESRPAIETAIDTLHKVTHVRNGSQHAG